MSVLPHHRRAATVSSPIGDVSFIPSSEPPFVTYYEARIYAEGTTTPVLATKYLGKPAAEVATGKIKVNMRTTFNALPNGNYVVGIAAVGAGGTSETISDIAYAVPLS
jgi:hypothetical protein